MTSPSPTGDQHELRIGSTRAVVTEVGGGLRSLVVDGRDLVVPFPADLPRPLYRGSVLVPWPNRVADGAYRFADTDQQLALTEPDRGNALHGLTCWAPWSLLERTDSSLTLTTRVWPQQGWPHLLATAVTYELLPTGLRWTVATTNDGTTAAPYGSSVHPYLVAGPGGVDDWELDLAVDQVLAVDGERLLPLGLEPVADTEFDFRDGRPLRGLMVDHAFTGLPGAEATATVWAPGGTGVALTWSTAELPWVQVHTADRPEPEHDRVGLAVEPMTCPPDAFRSGTDLVVLQPGDRHTATWTIEAVSR